MTTPAEQFLQATEVLILAVLANQRLKNTQSEVALSDARAQFIKVSGPNIAGVLLPIDPQQESKP